MSASKILSAALATVALLCASPVYAVIMITGDEIWDGIQNPHAADGVTLNVTGTIAAGNWVATYTIPQEVYIAPGANVYLHDIANPDTSMDVNWNFTGAGGLRFGDANSTIDVTKGGRNLSPSLKAFTLNMNNNPISGDVPGAGRIINGIYVLGAMTGDSLGVNINGGTAPVAIGTIDVTRDDAFSAAVNVTTRGFIDIDNIGTSDPNTGGGSAMSINVTGESMVLGNFNGFQNRTSGGSQATINLRALGQPENSVGDFSANFLAQNTITLDGLVKTNGTGAAGTSDGGNLIVNTVKLTLAPTFALDLNEGAVFTANVGQTGNGFTEGQMFVNNSPTAPTTVNYTVFHDNFGPAAVSWANDASGNWANATNWTPNSAPNANNMVATIGSVVTMPQTIFLNTGAIAKGLVFDTTAKVAVAGPAVLTLESNSGNASLSVLQGNHEVQAQITLQSNTSASAAAGTSVNLNGVLNLNGRTLNISGAGAVNINNTVTGLGAIANGGTLGTGGATGLSGNLTSTGTLAIDIAGAATNSYDSWNISGNATLSGVLSVDTIAGFIPTAGQMFTVLSAATLNAAALTLGGPDAAKFSLIKNPTSLVLQALNVGNVAGDYNQNGVVDAADYVVWRNSNGQNVTPGSGADGDGNGTVNASDYSYWRARFGNTSGSGSSLTGAVPEPTTAMMAVLAGLAMTVAGHRRCKLG